MCVDSHARASFRFLPVLGWTMMMSEFVFARRDWQKDREVFANALSRLKDFPNPMWMVIFPEGTRCTPKKLEKSVEFAKANNLPVFNHVLLPRTKVPREKTVVCVCARLCVRALSCGWCVVGG